MLIDIYLNIKFLINEMATIKSKISNIRYFFKDIDLLKYLLYKIYKKNLYFKDKNLNNFIKKNFKKNISKKFFFNYEILVDLTLNHHPEYGLLNCLIANDLKNKLNQNICALVNIGDEKTIKIANSFGINNFIYYKKKNFIQRLFYFSRAIKIIQENYSIRKILRIRYKNIDIGKCSYEHFIRFHTNANFEINFNFYLSLAKALEAVDFFEEIYTKNNFKHSVIAETQFIPHKIFFQSALRKKNIVYARYGSGLENYNVRIYRNLSNSFSHKRKYSKNLINFLMKNFKKKINKEINKYFKKTNPQKKIGFEDAFVKNSKKINIINFKKKSDFYKKLKINKKNKINILILPNVLQDNILNAEWSLFESPFDWFTKSLNIINKIKKFNWIIKPHPAEKYYRQDLKAKKIFDKVIFKSDNIKLLEESIHINNIHKYVDFVITYNGSCGYEYSALGIPVLTSADTRYSDFNFTIAPKNIKKYLFILKNVDKVIKKFKVNKFNAKLFWYLDNCYFGIMRMSHGLLPKMATQGSFENVDWGRFWKNLILNFNKKKINNNFSKNFILQQKNLNRHSINLSLLNIKKNVKFNDA